MHTLTPQQIENNLVWINELRSGKFEQGTGKLCGIKLEKIPISIEGYSFRKEDCEFCCLGVAEFFLNPNFIPKFDGWIFSFQDGVTGGLSHVTVEKLGIRNRMGRYLIGNVEESLASMNDMKVPFVQIANLIEVNLKDNKNKLFA